MRRQIDRLILAMPPRHGKPCYVGAMILMADGSQKRLGDVMVGDRVITDKGHARAVLAVHDQGPLPVVTIETELGRKTVAALTHPFLTPLGWKRADALVVGDVLALVPSPQIEASSTRSLAEFAMAGYFIGDGQVGARTTYARITCADMEIVADFTALMAELGFATRRMNKTDYGYSFVGPDRKKTTRSPLHWLRDIGLAGNAHAKRVPEWVFRGTTTQIGAFLGAYFACDGYINARGKARSDAAVEFYSVSRELLADVRHLLLRLGVRSRLVGKNGRYKGNWHHSWRLAVSSVDDVIKARSGLRIVGAKARRLADWPLKPWRFEAPYLPDRIVALTREPLALPCRCLEVSEDHTFTVDDIVVHNTELASRRYTPFALGHYPTRNFIMSSAGDELATEIGAVARDCVNSQAYHDIFPDVRLKMDSKAAGRWNTVQGGGLYAVGVSTNVMGRGAHDWIIDDPFGSWADAQSELARKKVRDWYQGTVYNRLEPDGAIIIIAHRMHDDDLIGYVLEEMKNGGDQWTIVELKAEAEANDPLGRPKGAALWPEKYNEEVLARIKRNSLPQAWSALYQQNPQPDDGTFFQRAWLEPRMFEEHELPDTDDFGVSDYAVSEGEGDFTELGIVGIDAKWNIWIRDWWFGQTSSDVWADKLVQLVEDYKPYSFFGEKGLIEKATKPLMTRAMDEAQAWTDLAYLPSIQDKPARARALQGMAAQGKIRLPKGDTGKRILEQMLRFPMGKNDDVVDALGLIARAIEEAHPAIKAIAGDKPKRRSGWDDDEDERTGDNWKTK